MTDRPRRLPLPLPLAVLVALPGTYLGAAAYLGLPHPELPAPLAALIYGIAIVGAAFVLSWAAEAAQVDISAGLALAVLALLAVLPEYAVDFVFSFQAGQLYAETGACVPNPEGENPCTLALANMTGANRVLVGVGWPLVVLVAVIAVRRAGRDSDSDSGSGSGSGKPTSEPAGTVRMPRSMAAEIVFLGIATLYSLQLPLRSSLTLLDAAVLVSIFVWYAVRLSKAPAEEPELIGTSAWIGGQDRVPRRSIYIGFAVSILIKLALSARAATVLFVLFAVQFFSSILLSAEVDRVIVVALSGVYLVLACIQLVRHRHELLRATRDGLVTPFDELTDDDRVAASS